MTFIRILVSFIFCFFCFILVRIADNYILSEFLRFNEINHDYHLFFIKYKSGQIDNWTEGKLIFINTMPYILSVLIGIYLPHFFRYSKRIVQLFITWFSFQLVLLFIGSLISGLLEYKGLGITLVWFLKYKSIQVIAVVFILLILWFSIRRYAWYFIRCMPDCVELFDTTQKSRYLLRIALYPFVLSMIVVLSMNSKETLLNHSISQVTGLLLIVLLFQTLPDVLIPNEIKAAGEDISIN